MTQRKIAELVRKGDFVGSTQVAKTIADTSRKAMEELIVTLYDQTNGGGVLRWCEPDVANDAAATLLVLLAERDAARSELHDALAENDALRFFVHDMNAEIEALRAQLANARSSRDDADTHR